MRLNRYLARAGVASRRKSDDLIRAGSVTVNGEIVDRPGSGVAPGRDSISVLGREIVLPESFEYLLFNKNAGSLVTRSDEMGRSTVFDHVPNVRQATVAVGRLDRDTTGALLLTDDGELAYRLMHPKFEVIKRYRAVVKGRPDESCLEQLRSGVELEDGPTAPASVMVESAVHGARDATLVIAIHEGRKHQVKRMCTAVGHRVKTLERIDFAGLTTRGLETGDSRGLDREEIQKLLSLVGLER